MSLTTIFAIVKSALCMPNASPGRGESQPSLPLIEGGIRNDVDAQCLCDLADAHRVHRATVVLEHLDDLDFNLDLACA